jgi:hypothetical protein
MMFFALDDIWQAIAAGGPVAVVLAFGLTIVWTKLWGKLEALEAQNASLASEWIKFLRELAASKREDSNG